MKEQVKMKEKICLSGLNYFTCLSMFVVLKLVLETDF